MSAALPRVTAILEAVGLGPDLSRIPPAVLEAARLRGSAVHAAIEADAYGYLEADSVTPEIAPYLDAYRKFVAESGHTIIASERAVVHPEWQYVGHIDRVGWIAGRRVILDWKSGTAPDLRAAGYQLSGYRLAWNAANPTAPIEATAVVQLEGDGTYHFHEVATVQHEQAFLAAVVIHRARTEWGR